MVTAVLGPVANPARRRAGLAAGSTTVGALGIGLLTAWHPVAVLAAVVACTAVVVMTLRLEAAVLVYVAAEPFAGYLEMLHATSVKLLGLVVFAAWAVRLATDDRPPALRHRVVYAAGALLLAVLAALVVHPHGADGVAVAVRYLSYVAVLVVLVDSMRTRLDPWRVVRVFVVACSVAAAVALVAYLRTGGRAAGPVEDANDFALYLLCALPFALALWQRPGAHRSLWGLSVVVLTVALLATFSRGAILGLGVVVALGLVLGVLRWHVVALGAVAIAGSVLAIVVLAPDLVTRSFEAKQHVADSNVSSRFTAWTLAAEMTVDSPLVGQGPGGYSVQFDDYLGSRVTNPPHLDVAHHMYLDVSSETGLLGLGAFGALLLAGGTTAWRARRRPGHRDLALAVCLSLAGVLTGALFLSAQFYLPVWLLLALAVALSRERSR